MNGLRNFLLAEGCALTDELENRIRKTLRENASPRYVPARIIEVPDIPYTLNMKKVEIAVTNIIHGYESILSDLQAPVMRSSPLPSHSGKHRLSPWMPKQRLLELG